MGEISLDFRPGITPVKMETLKRVVADMEAGQHLSITLERTDAHQADEILEILKENNYNYQTKGGHQAEFYIKAKKL
ncbi:MAG: hypothetical protein PWR10_1582 [Halanaerobiales bacterium]|nr:hypothetical protein [Halanaerobiales bacterium]